LEEFDVNGKTDERERFFVESILSRNPEGFHTETISGRIILQKHKDTTTNLETAHTGFFIPSIFLNRNFY